MEILGVLGAGIFTIGIAALVIFIFVFWIRMIIDCVNREFKNPNDRIVWILVVIFLQLLGAIIYWSVIKKPASSSVPK